MKSSVRRRLRGLIFTFALLAFLILAAASGLQSSRNGARIPVPAAAFM